MPSQKLRYHPEARVGGYSSVDGTVEFYLRIHALLMPGQRVVDFGAGRGASFDDGSSTGMRRKLLDLRGDGRIVIGCDVDPAVLRNPAVDEAVVLERGRVSLPFGDDSVDMIVSDWTFEHLPDPGAVASEFKRVLKPSGWFCVRTPNRHGYISVANRLIPDRWHRLVLRAGQKGREARDVFPTCYLVNTERDLHRLFGGSFDLTVYFSNPEPSYLGESRVGWAMMKAFERVVPRRFCAVLLAFGQKY